MDFHRPCGGFTVEVGGGKARLAVRYDDSPGLSKVPPVQARPGRHPEGLWEESSVEYGGELKAITVVADYRLTVRVLLNGKEALSSNAPLDVNRHQLAFAGGEGPVRGDCFRRPWKQPRWTSMTRRASRKCWAGAALPRLPPTPN